MNSDRTFPFIACASVVFACGWALAPAVAAPAQARNNAAAAPAAEGAQNAVACASCHGIKGEGNAAAGFPRLAGLSASYLQQQLRAFATGQRQNAVMQPMAMALTPPQQVALATYFSGLPASVPTSVADPSNLKSTDVGPWLALRGRWDENLPACIQCHGPGGAGVGAAFPPLAGQSAAYIEAQLHAFKKHTRPGGPMNLMGVVASKLSDADITAVANYYGVIKTAKASDSLPEEKK
jgi:cytochrome c553